MIFSTYVEITTVFLGRAIFKPWPLDNIKNNFEHFENESATATFQLKVISFCQSSLWVTHNHGTNLKCPCVSNPTTQQFKGNREFKRNGHAVKANVVLFVYQSVAWLEEKMLVAINQAK